MEFQTKTATKSLHTVFFGTMRLGKVADKIPDEETLRTLYHERGMTLQEIADETGVFRYKIWKAMDDHGIQRRAKGPVNTEPTIRTYWDGYERVVHHDGHESQAVKLHRLNALVDHSLDELRGKHVHHKNGVTWLSHPANLEVLTPSEHGKRHSPEPLKNAANDLYVSPIHYWIENQGDTQVGEESPGIRVYKG